MTIEGPIRKMITEHGNPIRYYLNLKGDFLDVNQQLGKKIRLIHDHTECVGCGFQKDLFRMGYCKTCFFSLPQTNESIIRPELSTAHLGIEQRDLEWEKKFELTPHIVYLAVSADIKVGVTRESQIPIRWIDQGATHAIVFAKTENRYQAGMIEVALKNHVSDKTSYQKMLRNELVEIDLIQQKDLFRIHIPEEHAHFYSNDSEILSFEYPVLEFPKKIKTLNLKKENQFEGKLIGVKGQYWIFEEGIVWNVRAHEGSYVKFEFL